MIRDRGYECFRGVADDDNGRVIFRDPCKSIFDQVFRLTFRGYRFAVLEGLVYELDRISSTGTIFPSASATCV
jgi:hypothetical protein